MQAAIDEDSLAVLLNNNWTEVTQEFQPLNCLNFHPWVKTGVVSRQADEFWTKEAQKEKDVAMFGNTWQTGIHCVTKTRWIEKADKKMCHSHYVTYNNVSSASTQVRLFHLLVPSLTSNCTFRFLATSCSPFSATCLRYKSFQTRFHRSTSHGFVMDAISTNRK